RVHALERFESEATADTQFGAMNRSAVKHILRSRDQLLRLIRSRDREGEAPAEPPRRGNRKAQHELRPPDAEETFLRSLLAAYPDRLARRREPGSRRGVMVGGRGVRLADESALADEELFLCID